jgi:hypothetical protein
VRFQDSAAFLILGSGVSVDRVRNCSVGAENLAAEEDGLLIADRNFFNWADWCTADSGAHCCGW